jgi:hypothetical protein
VTIFKSGYKPITGGPWAFLVEEDWGSPKGTYILNVEGGKPVILLRKATDIQQRDRDIGRVRSSGYRLLENEIKKEDEVIRLCKRTGRC